MKILLHVLFWVMSSLSINAQEINLEVQKQYQTALDLMSAYQFDKAQELLSECYIQHPENTDFLLKIAYCNFQSGRYRDAKIFYNKVLKLDSTNTIAISSLGSLFERELNYAKAQNYYQQLITIDSTNSYYFKRNGFLALRLSDVYSSINYFLKAHELNEADLEVIDQLSSIYLALDQLDYAESILDKGLSLDGKNIKLLYNNARLSQKRKNHPAVIHNIELAMAQGDTSNYYQMMLGVAYIQSDSLNQGIFHLEEIIKRKKDNEHTHHYLGIAYREKKDLEKCIYHLEKAIEKGLSVKMAIYHADLGSVYVEQTNHRKAIEHYEKAYGYGGEKEHLFHLAHNSDLYYKDKKIALRHYRKYLASKDQKFRDYATKRIGQLKEILHFQK